MILIADSGSTKTDWAIVSNQGVNKIKSIGLNPYFINEKEIEKEIQNQFSSQLSPSISRIYFYGAGLSNKQSTEIIANALRSNFKQAQVYVYHDLLGAARATCQKQEGLTAILGTGSNSCYYNGDRIIENRIALGFILGDEGSGAYIGKRLISDFLNEEIPKKIRILLTENFDLSASDIFQKVYKENFPNRYLASFAKFVSQNNTIEYFNLLLKNSFQEFLNKHILKYPNAKHLPLNVVGSVGYFNQNTLKEVVQENGLKLGVVIPSPIEGLIRYHKMEV